MHGRVFFASAPGRIAGVIAFIALLGPGIMALAGPSVRDASYAACLVIACIIGFGCGSSPTRGITGSLTT